MDQTLEVMMRGSIDPVLIEGSMEKFAGEINLQMAQGKNLILMKTPDGSAIALNVNNINTVKAPSPEDLFYR